MIIELLILQMTLDGIRSKARQDYQRQRAERDSRLVKLRLARLLEDYKSGTITPDEYRTIESRILADEDNKNVGKGHEEKRA